MVIVPVGAAELWPIVGRRCAEPLEIAGVDLRWYRLPAVPIAEQYQEVQRKRNLAAADLFGADAHRAAIARRPGAYPQRRSTAGKRAAALAAIRFGPRKDPLLQHGPLADHVGKGEADEDAEDLFDAGHITCPSASECRRRAGLL